MDWYLLDWMYIDGEWVVTGELDLENTQWVTDDQSGPAWSHGLSVSTYAGFDDLVEGTDMAAASGCALSGGTCDEGVPALGQDVGSPVFSAIPETTWSTQWVELVGSGFSSVSAESFDNVLGVELSGESVGPWSLADIGDGLSNRCDQEIGSTSGCVNESFTPTLTYDSITNPKVEPVAQHIYTAQTAPVGQGGLSIRWGVPSNALHRDTKAADNTANNTAACAGFVPAQPGDNCDEFPMASTYEGAAFQPVYSIASVPAAANSSQGGLTSSFYTSNRILDGVDPFYVKAVLLNGASSW